jgi:hypothetical protein
MNSTRTTRDAVLTTINVVVWLFMLTAIAFSTSHIIETSHRLGLTFEAFAVPVFVDGIALVGKLSMLPRFSRRFRRSGLKLLMFGGILSLAANVYAGHTIGQKAFGVLVVAGFMILEGHVVKAADKVAAIAAPAAAEVDLVLQAKRSEAARKGAETRKANAAAKTAKVTTRKPRAPKPATVEALEESFAMASAPVSGA